MLSTRKHNILKMCSSMSATVYLWGFLYHISNPPIYADAQTEERIVFETKQHRSAIVVVTLNILLLSRHKFD